MLLGALLVVAAASCRTDTVESPDVEVTDLPALASPSGFESILARRASVRDFTAERLSWEETGRILWAAQGVTRPWGGRTAPSAGALYPLEVYAVTPGATYHYLPDGHRIALVVERDLRAELARAALDQTWVGDAPLVVVIAGVYERTAATYGERAERYVHLEAGHAGQNVLLAATDLGLGAVPVGAFDDEAVRAVLGLAVDQRPLYLIPVGHVGG